MNAKLLKDSFEAVTPRKTEFAHRFYERLFSSYPAVKPLFAQTDMQRQESSLMATIGVVVAGVERGDDLVPTLRQLGSRHKGYGVQAEHYPLVGTALLETLHEFLGEGFTQEVKDAWLQAFTVISEQMLIGEQEK